MHKAVSLFTFAVAAIIAAWWWLGRPVMLPPSPLGANEKLACVSYAPFRDAQSPLDLATRIPPEQIEQDLAQLARISECVRTYSVDYGLDRVPDIARKYGLKVMLGLWVSSHADRTKYQIDIGTSLARRFPDVVRAVIVGNEALLRGEVSATALADLIRSVKVRVPMPVTYADVWEFWLRHRELAAAVDFVTVHILPYWEDEPIAAEEAAEHVAAIRKHVAAAFPGKEVAIGEVGWPSAGRMRAGARPSPANQARVVQDILARAKRDGFRVNVIEAFDQPWKRYQEGTVGGHWGLFDNSARAPKFVLGGRVSDHPHWQAMASAGVALAFAAFAGALVTLRRRQRVPGLAAWGAIALGAAAGGILLGLSLEQAAIESFGMGGWLRSLAWVGVALAAPVVASAALAGSVAVPDFAAVIGSRDRRTRDPLALALGLVAVAVAVLALQSALALAFDPRYRDFPFAPLTGAALPLMLASLLAPAARGRPALAESTAAATLLLCAIAIVWNEGWANWQAMWFAGGLLLLAVTLLRARAARDSESATP